MPHLTGGLSEPKVPDTGERRWYANLTHDLTIPEAERWLLAEATPGSRFLTVRELFRARALALPVAQRRGGAGVGYRPDGVLVLPDGRRVDGRLDQPDRGAPAQRGGDLGDRVDPLDEGRQLRRQGVADRVDLVAGLAGDSRLPGDVPGDSPSGTAVSRRWWAWASRVWIWAISRA